MSMLYDLEAMMADRGLDVLQHGQRDFSPHLIHFTNKSAMDSISGSLAALKEKPEGIQRVPDLLKSADSDSRAVLKAIISSGELRTSKFDEWANDTAVCLTECTLAGVMTHSIRYGRYGLVFPKSVVYESDGRPVAYVPKEVRSRVRSLAREEPVLEAHKRFFTIFSPPMVESGRVQDYSHEREWRCPTALSVSEAVAVIVAKVSDYEQFRDLVPGRPVLPLELLYQMGV